VDGLRPIFVPDRRSRGPGHPQGGPLLARNPPIAPRQRHPFPWWGWAGMAAGVVAWCWRDAFPVDGHLQPHTFTPLWLAYIVVVNALLPLSHGELPADPLSGLLLEPVSGQRRVLVFFEYLNRFVQNWYYVGGGRSARGRISGTPLCRLPRSCRRSSAPRNWCGPAPGSTRLRTHAALVRPGGRRLSWTVLALARPGWPASVFGRAFFSRFYGSRRC